MNNKMSEETASQPGSLIDVAQPFVPGVHQLVDGVVVQDTIRRDRGRELREGLLIESAFFERLLTVT